jgi:hypothetical protein
MVISQQCGDDILLAGTERRIAEDLLEHGQGVAWMRLESYGQGSAVSG